MSALTLLLEETPSTEPMTPELAYQVLGLVIDQVGLGFHWDNMVRDYGLELTPTEVQRLEFLLARAYRLLASEGLDPYAVALELMRQER